MVTDPVRRRQSVAVAGAPVMAVRAGPGGGEDRAVASGARSATRAVGLAGVTLEEVLEIVDGKVVSSTADLSAVVTMGCGADLMSDVLAFTHAGTLLMTGLTNPQVVRTAEMAGIVAIIFVRGKYPPPETIALAEEKGIPLLATRYTLYETCGRLYAAGLPGCGLFNIGQDGGAHAANSTSPGR